jgi:peptide-methionine (R)-S-oxide reductase
MLSKEQKHILFEEGTEPPGTSPLNYEKREGDYLCAGCGTKLFESKLKYESGSGWPSFFEALPNVFETKVDNSVG